MDPLIMVEQRLTRLETKVDLILERTIRQDERLRARSGAWGFIGGALPAAGVLVYWLVGG
jgi:hypothetical protein